MAIWETTNINDPKYITNTTITTVTQYNLLSGEGTPTLIGLTILGIFLLKTSGK